MSPLPRSLTRLGLFCMLAGFVAVGCGSQDVERLAVATTSTSSAISGDFTDASGLVTVRIKACAATAPQAYPQTTCAVDTEFVLVGGGAEILNDGIPGAMLTASYPDSNLTTWTAASKEHMATYSHQLRAYVIGLRLAGVSPNELRKNMLFLRRRSSVSERPSISVEMPPDYLLVGGGARANWSTQGLLLTESYPDSVQWVASAKDHFDVEQGTVDVFAIGIPEKEIEGFGGLDVVTNSNFSFVANDYGSESVLAPSGWVPASVGGRATYRHNGRMLTELIPYADYEENTKLGAWVGSKDHMDPDAGETHAYVVSIQKR